MTSPFRLVLCSMTLLIAIGTVMVVSTSLIPMRGDALTYSTLIKQMIWILAGCVGLYAAQRVGVRRLERWHLPVFGVTVALLILVLIPGVGSKINGARRWVRVSGYGIQPSEFAKIGLLIFTAAMIARHQAGRLRSRFGLLPVIAAIAFCALLILVEPDVGTALFVGAICLILFVLAGVEARMLLPIAAVGGVLLGAVVLLKFDHVQRRIDSFLNPEADIQGKGYQLHQSKIAIASGGLTGDGLGASTQKLFFLPERTTDFVLSIYAEETGLAGVLLVVGLFLMFLYGGMKICLRCRDLYSFLLAFGVTFMVGLQAIANIAVVTGSVPTKGISLPFISFGGSGLVATMMGVGLLYDIAREHEKATAAAPAMDIDSSVAPVPA